MSAQRILPTLSKEPGETSVFFLGRRELRDYQIPMFQYGISVPNPVFLVEMRLGKTLVTVRVLKYRRCRFNLIFAPFSAFDSWYDELYAEGYRRIFRFDISKSKYDRYLTDAFSGYGKLPTWCIVNHDIVRTKYAAQFSGIDWHALIADESTFLKNPESIRTREMQKQFAHRNAVHVLLTGTPAPETELEYHQQLTWVDPSILKETDYYKWRFYNFTRSLDPTCKDWYIKHDAKKKLAATLAKHCFFLKRDQVDLGGEIIEEVKSVYFPPEIQKLYDDMEKNFLMEIDGVTYKTIWAVARFMFLRRLSGGVLDGKIIWKGKLDTLRTLCETELRGQQIIVCAHFREEITAIVETLSGIGKVSEIHGGISKDERNRRRRLFQERKIQFIVIQPETQKFGADYSAASTMIHYSLPPGLETFQQVNSRFVKIGKTESLLMIYLITKGTVDVGLLKGLRAKKNSTERMQLIVQEVKNKYGYL